MYLGAHFVSDGKILSCIEAHCKSKSKQLTKLLNFFSKNRDAPYSVKKKVVDAAFSSSLLYSCESWLNSSCDKVSTLYISAIKSLLNVRTTTANALCYVEADYAPVKYVVKEYQKRYFTKILNRDVTLEDPLKFVLDLHRNASTPFAHYLSSLDTPSSFVTQGNDHIKQSVRQSQRSKFSMYVSLNPDLSQHPVYCETNVPEYQRVIFTRLRLSAHNLKVETGRWARIPREERLCSCGTGRVQTEEHVLIDCPLSEPLRLQYPDIVFQIPTLFESPSLAVTSYIYNCLNIY